MSARAWNVAIIVLAVCVLACALFVALASFAGGVGAQSRDLPFDARPSLLARP